MWETHPELASQLVDPQDGWKLTAKSNKKALWTCGKHEWEAAVDNRSKGRGCPFCSGYRATPETCLAVVDPELSSQLVDQSLATRLTAWSNKKVLWTCGKHEWKARVNDRSNGSGCPYCSGKKVCNDNCLAAVNPLLAGELVDQSLAKKLTAGSHKKAMWTCGKHEWEAAVNDRSRGRGCPFCSGHRVTPETCLAVVNPELASQLVDQSLATKLTARSGKKVMWTCGRHEWEAAVDGRSRGSGCPKCASSRMNKWSAELCKELGLTFEAEWRHEDCKDKQTLPFDIAIGVTENNGTPTILVECHGRQHFESVEYFGGQEALEAVQRRDQIKRDYASDNRIPLLEVHYSQRDFKPAGWSAGEWFREKLLAELLTAGVIDWTTFSKHSKPYQYAETDRTSLPADKPDVDGNIQLDLFAAC